jgi:hypothetical protein
VKRKKPFALRIADVLRQWADNLESDYCLVCNVRNVLYRDGKWDCPELSEQAQKEHGGKA